MAASIAAAHAGVTTGEWANTLRRVWGEYRAPTGVAGATVKTSGSGATAETVDRLRAPPLLDQGDGARHVTVLGPVGVEERAASCAFSLK